MKKIIFPLIALLVVIMCGCSKSDEQLNLESEHYDIENKLISGSGATSFQRVITGNSDGYGGRNDILLNSVKQTSDLGYIFCGTIRLYDKPGTFILKTNNVGETEWLNTISDGFGSNGLDVEVTEDNGFIIAGETFLEQWHTIGAPSDGLLIKVDENGNLSWKKSFSILTIGQLHKIFVTGNGELLAFGHGWGGLNGSGVPNENIFIKTNHNGDEIWRKSLSGGRIQDTENTKDGGFVLCGLNDLGACVIKINNDGEEIWSSGIAMDYPTSIKVLQDGYAICGIEYIAKLDNFGNMIWSKNYETEVFKEQGFSIHHGTYYTLYDIIETKDNNFIAIGGYDGHDFDKDVAFSRAHLLKIDSENGEIIWIKPFSPEEGNGLAEIHKCIDDGFIIAGTTADYDNKSGSNSPSWGYIAKTDENGN